MFNKITKITVALLIFVLSLLNPLLKSAKAFKLPEGYPYVLPYIYESMGYSILFWEHVTLQNRFVTYVTSACYDVQALYHPTARPYLAPANKRRRGKSHSDEDVNIAVAYAAHGMASALLPEKKAEWDNILLSLDLDPNANNRGWGNPIGLARRVVELYVERAMNDGANQDGKINCEHNCVPFSDYTGWTPSNPFDRLQDIDKWQPRLVDDSKTGLFRVQQHITPYWSKTKPWVHPDPTSVHVPPPAAYPSKDMEGFRREMRKVIDAQSKIGTFEKLSIELWDAKVFSYGYAVISAAQQLGLNSIEYNALDMGIHFAIGDAMIHSWSEKLKYNYIRPMTGIRTFMANETIVAYSAEHRGAAEIKGSEFRSYQNTAAHTEHPSGSACFCAAWAQFSREFFGTENVAIQAPFPKGSSRIEPGFTPEEDYVLHYATITEAQQTCKSTRLWGGVHFEAANDAGDFCAVFGHHAAVRTRELLGYDFSGRVQ